MPGTLQVLGTQLGKADKVQASVGLPFWRWHQMATSALKIGAEGPGGRQGCFMEGEQEVLSGEGMPDQPASCPCGAPALQAGQLLSSKMGTGLLSEGQPGRTAGQSGPNTLGRREMLSEHQAGSAHGQELGFYLNGDGEAAGKQILAQVLTFSCKDQQRKRMWAQAQTGRSGKCTETLTGDGQVFPS